MNEFQKHEEALFIAAVQLPASQRALHLDQACAGDADLRRRVEALLKAHEQAGAFLEKPAVMTNPSGSGATIQVTVPSMEKAGDKIGRYKLLQQIGEGGCGVVYMAEQQEPVRRRVALKVIKVGMDTKNVIARFEAERQALALMDHPNIAKVLDAGATETGRPFFVMELVRGIRITDYCDQNKLPTRERLDLFIKVCHAIQHAHQKGIIHRDIKPSNILIAMHDGVPLPKVIDFGIAKATDQRLTEKTLFTAFEQFMGTPAYMSPEQAEMSALDVDTRSDIYSLGVLLYELLTSKTPFDAGELLKAGLDEMRRTIREKEPVRPSTRLKTMLEADLTNVAGLRRAEPEKLSVLIRGDLDWIVMKALEKDRTRRYETANGLAADVKRYLQNEPVTATPPSRVYRFRKMASRNKAAFAAGVTVLAALLAGLGVSTHSLVQEKRANEIALTEVRRSQQVARFLQDMLKGVGPETAKGRDTQMLREILDETADKIGAELAGLPQVEAEMRSTIGQVYYDLGEYAHAREMQTRAVELTENSFGKASTNAASALQQLGLTLIDSRDYPQAEVVDQKALRIWMKTVGTNAPGTALTLNDLGLVHWYRGDLAGGEDYISQALKIRKELPGDNRVGLVESYCNLGTVLRDQGRWAESAAAERQSLALQRSLHPEGSLNEFYPMNNLGNALLDQGDLAGAEKAYHDGLTILTKYLPEDHPLATLERSHLSTTKRRLGAMSGDPALFREALQLNPTDPLTADALACSIADSVLTPVGEDPRSASVIWHCATSTPGPDWTRLDYADKIWSSSADIFGFTAYSSRSGRVAPGHTNLWLRQKFELPELPTGSLVLRLNRNQDAEVYLNGVLVAPMADWSDASVTVRCSAAGQAALKAGRNVLAVHCQDADGGAHIGVGLYMTEDPALGRKELIAVFGQMIKNEPGRVDLYTGRASALARMGQWNAAQADLVKAIELKPSAVMAWTQLAPVLLEAGDEAGYQRHRRNALERFANPEDPNTAEQVAKLSLLLPAEGPEIEQAEKLADVAAAVDYADWNLAGRQFTKGLAEYRLGYFAGAIEWTGKALATGARHDLPGWSHERERNRNAAAYLVQAMAHQQLNQSVEAHAALATGMNIIKTQFPNADSGDLGREWPDCLVARVLSREAQTLIGF